MGRKEVKSIKLAPPQWLL